VGLVGESGCGKSMTSMSILRLVPQPAGRIVGGEIRFKGNNLLDKSEEEMRQIRGDRISMIVQDAMVSLNPLLKVGYQLAETLKHHGKALGAIKEKCVELLNKVKVPSPETRLEAYPFQFSGGMSQRALIANGIACDPDLIIGPDHRRRAHNGPGCDDTGPDPESVAGDSAEGGGFGAADHPRPGGGGPDLHPGAGDVRRTDR
jgi:ABC-type dipeptide/oligopeptide/nickel transport system ATPase component